MEVVLTGVFWGVGELGVVWGVGLYKEYEWSRRCCMGRRSLGEGAGSILSYFEVWGAWGDLGCAVCREEDVGDMLVYVHVCIHASEVGWGCAVGVMWGGMWVQVAGRCS